MSTLWDNNFRGVTPAILAEGQSEPVETINSRGGIRSVRGAIKLDNQQFFGMLCCCYSGGTCKGSTANGESAIFGIGLSAIMLASKRVQGWGETEFITPFFFRE